MLRLYQQDNDEVWLNVVKIVRSFYKNDYWQYHDHWLELLYTNELVQIAPKEEYFEFGIKNVNNYLDYIEQRETTFPTF